MPSTLRSLTIPRRSLTIPRRSLTISGAWLAAALFGCGGPGPATPAELRQALDGARSLEVQVAGAQADGALRLAVQRATLDLGPRLGVEASWRAGPVPDSETCPRIVVGPLGDPGVARLFQELGGTIEEDVARFGELELRRDESVLHLCGEDPDRPGLPLELLTSRLRPALLDAVEDLRPLARPGAVLMHPMDPRESRGPSGTTSAPPPPPFPRFAEASGAGAVLLRPLSGVPAEAVATYGARCKRALAEVEAWTGASPEERLELLLVSHGDHMRELTGESELAVAEGPRGRRVVLLARGLPDDRGACAARWAAVEVLGPPVASWWLDGAAYDAADHWWGRRLEEWGLYLARQGLLPTVQEIVAPASVDRLSQHVLAPARGLLFRHLRQTLGDATLRELWTGERELVVDRVLDAGFAGWLEPEGGAASHPARRVDPEGFLAGVAIDSNTRAGGGFDGRDLVGALRAARKSGQDAISFTSYFTEAPAADGFGGRLPRGRAALEGDVALAQAFAAARRAGFETLLLQPHLLLSDSAGHSAWLRRTSSAHWDEFFDELEPMLVHYGLLGELCGVDVLCVGTRLSSPSGNAGLSDEARAHFDARWLGAIDLVRRAFGGELTYAAAWPGEAGGVRFWPALDFVGVSLFPRFTELGRPPLGEAALRERWAKLLEELDELARGAGRPALVVELGMRSTAAGTTETLVGSGALDLAEQERGYRALARALDDRREAGEAPAGLFLWKWTGDGRGGGADDRGFTPQGKPAARLLPRLRGLRADDERGGDEATPGDGEDEH